MPPTRRGLFPSVGGPKQWRKNRPMQTETAYQRQGRLQRERQAARQERERKRLAKPRRTRRAKDNDRPREEQIVDGYNRDDLGPSPDY